MHNNTMIQSQFMLCFFQKIKISYTPSSPLSKPVFFILSNAGQNTFFNSLKLNIFSKDMLNVIDISLQINTYLSLYIWMLRASSSLHIIKRLYQISEDSLKGEFPNILNIIVSLKLSFHLRVMTLKESTSHIWMCVIHSLGVGLNRHYLSDSLRNGVLKSKVSDWELWQRLWRMPATKILSQENSCTRNLNFKMTMTKVSKQQSLREQVWWLMLKS